MLRLISSFIGKPVLSLQTGARIGIINESIIDPDKLQVVGFYVESPRDTGSILLTNDIREVNRLGVIVDRMDSLVDPEDLVRHKDVLALQYRLIDKKVVTENGRKLGKVSDYIVEDQTMHVARLYTRPTLTKVITKGGSLIVDRSQIVEINDSQVVIREPLGKVKAPAAAEMSLG